VNIYVCQGKNTLEMIVGIQYLIVFIIIISFYTAVALFWGISWRKIQIFSGVGYELKSVFFVLQIMFNSVGKLEKKNETLAKIMLKVCFCDIALFAIFWAE